MTNEGEATPAAGRSRTATIAAVLGIAGPGLTLFGVLLPQLGAAPMAGFGLFQLALLSGLLALVTGLVALFVTRRSRGVGGRERAWLGTALGVGMIGIGVVSAAPGAGLPPINDITTNVTDPPAFAPAPEGHRNAGRDMSFPAEFVEVVTMSYPDLVPIAVDVPPERAFALALAQAEALGWEITRQDAQRGTFEAEDTTALFRFVDDISVRVRPDGAAGAVIDVRSKSRDGRGDLGTNARRIRTFAAAFEGETGDVAASP